MRPQAVLLDVDGTLIDSNRAHAEAYVEAAAAWNLVLDVERVAERIGKGGDKMIPELTGHPQDSGPGQDLESRKKQIFLERMLPRLQPTPGARALLERLRADGIRLVVATSAGPAELQPLLERAGVADLLHDATSSADAERSKPDPDVIEAALAKANTARDRVLLVGDTPYDIEAAQRAGIAVVAVRCGGWDDAHLRGALAIYDDPADILARYADSPFAR